MRVAHRDARVEPQARRLSLIPLYLFHELDERKRTLGAKAQRSTDTLIDLGEGSPDRPTPAPIVGALKRALSDTENHRYPSYAGKLSAREAVADWYLRRFNVKLDPETEVTMLLGSKEGVSHLIWAVCGPGDVVAYGDPCYPIYPNQTRLAGSRALPVPLLEQNRFLPELDRLARIAGRAKLLCLNYPSNPTAAVADIGFFREVVRLAQHYGFYVLNDCVYSELYFGAKPPSILEVPGAKECCIEFHSLSKTFSMAGWRIGMAVGNRNLIQSLLRVKQNTDSGPFGAIQDAAAYALKYGGVLAAQNRALYKRRRDAFCNELDRSGWQVKKPDATFYVWARIPEGWESYGFTLRLLENCRVVAAPGNGFGRYGQGYVRFALVAGEQKLRRAARRIGRWTRKKGTCP